MWQVPLMMKFEDEYTRQIRFDKDEGNGRPEQSTEVETVATTDFRQNQRERGLNFAEIWPFPKIKRCPLLSVLWLDCGLRHMNPNKDLQRWKNMFQKVFVQPRYKLWHHKASIWFLSGSDLFLYLLLRASPSQCRGKAQPFHQILEPIHTHTDSFINLAMLLKVGGGRYCRLRSHPRHIAFCLLLAPFSSFHIHSSPVSCERDKPIPTQTLIVFCQQR